MATYYTLASNNILRYMHMHDIGMGNIASMATVHDKRYATYQKHLTGKLSSLASECKPYGNCGY